MAMTIIPALRSDLPISQTRNEQVLYVVNHIVKGGGFTSSAFPDETITLKEILTEYTDPVKVAQRVQYCLQKALDATVEKTEVRCKSTDLGNNEYSLELDIQDLGYDLSDQVYLKGHVAVSKDGRIDFIVN